MEDCEFEEETTIVQEHLEPYLIIGWTISRLLRNDVEYPKCLKVSHASTNVSTLELEYDKLSLNPTAHDIEEIKTLSGQFEDVSSDSEGSLKIMNCKTSVIDLMPDANILDSLPEEI